MSEDNVAKAVDWWMNSPAHRKNLLDPSYPYAGTYVIWANQYFPKYHGWQKVLYVGMQFYSEPYAKYANTGN